MRIIVTGSLAYDYLMSFPGNFKESLLTDRADTLTVSFLVNSMRRLHGGVSGNIAYNIALLGEKPFVVSTVGQDFSHYRERMRSVGIRTEYIREIENEFTASCFISTDSNNNQLVTFYPGAINHSKEVSLNLLALSRVDWVIISPTDPDAMARHAHECAAAGANAVFDPGKQTPRLSKEQILSGLKTAKVFIGNHYEFGLMSKATGLSEEQLFNMAPVTVMTHGERGSVIYERDSRQRHDLKAAKISRFVDPTGAGDAFLGGLAFGLAHRLPLMVAGRIATVAAAYAVERAGCQEHHYSREEFAFRYRENYGETLTWPD